MKQVRRNGLLSYKLPHLISPLLLAAAPLIFLACTSSPQQVHFTAQPMASPALVKKAPLRAALIVSVPEESKDFTFTCRVRCAMGVRSTDLVFPMRNEMERLSEQTLSPAFEILETTRDLSPSDRYDVQVHVSLTALELGDGPGCWAGNLLFFYIFPLLLPPDVGSAQINLTATLLGAQKHSPVEVTNSSVRVGFDEGRTPEGFSIARLVQIGLAKAITDVAMKLASSPRLTQLVREKPIHKAFLSGDLSAFQQEWDRTDEEKRFLSYYFRESIDKGRREFVTFALDHGANVDEEFTFIVSDNSCGPAQGACHMTPLMLAAKNGHADVIDMLLNSGADPNFKNEQGWTPLMAAVVNNHISAVETLLLGGAVYDERNQEGQSPLAIAEAKHHSSIARLLKLAQKGRVDKGRAPVKATQRDQDVPTHRDIVIEPN